jgi:hypothetical protein
MAPKTISEVHARLKSEMDRFDDNFERVTAGDDPSGEAASRSEKIALIRRAQRIQAILDQVPQVLPIT